MLTGKRLLIVEPEALIALDMQRIVEEAGAIVVANVAGPHLLLNAGLIEHLGFIISCTLAYVLAVQGLRRAYGKPHDTWLVDVITGFLISAPVYWMFTKFLAINLPGLTSTGWI